MRLLHLMNTSCSNFSVMSLVLSGRNILPALLKICSMGTEMNSTIFAIQATCGKSEVCDFHHANGSSS